MIELSDDWVIEQVENSQSNAKPWHPLRNYEDGFRYVAMTRSGGPWGPHPLAHFRFVTVIVKSGTSTSDSRIFF